MTSHRTSRAARGRIRDFGLYLLIGVAVAAAVLLYVPYSGAMGDDAITKWAGLAGNTLILFGYAVSGHKRLRRARSFWIALSLLLVVHFSLFIPLLLSVKHWKILWFVVMYPVETPLIDKALVWATERFPQVGARGGARRG